MRRIKISYNPKLKEKARKLRKQGTVAEVLLWSQLKNKKIKGYIFNRQKPIDNYIVDFYCYQLKLIIEVDGDSHGDKLEYDQKREQRLKQLGFNIIKFTDTEVKQNMDAIIEKINENI